MNPPESEGTIVWRVGTLEVALRDERIARHQAIDKLDNEKADAKDVARLASEVGGLRKAVIGFALTVAASSIGMIIAILATSHA